MTKCARIISLGLLIVLPAVTACNEGIHQSLGGIELSRVTSPDARVDAVLLREDGGGAPGGWEWYVYIVPKGGSIQNNTHPVLNAGTLSDAALAWRQSHLLEIRYGIADINQFRNLWALDEVQPVGATGEHDYLVEIRLAPVSTDFSLLTPAGTFKSSEH